MFRIKFYELLLIIGFISLFQWVAIAGTPLTIQNFNYGEWGSYYTVTYEGEPYFAGYVGGEISLGNIFTFNTTSNSGQLHRVLINDNNQRTVNINYTLALNDGYVLKIKDINMGAGTALVWLTMLKDGNEVYDDFMEEGQNFIYNKDVGAVKDLPIIAIHIFNISKVSKTVTIDGLFEISETFITVTPPSDMPMKITSWSNNQTNDQQLSITVPLGSVRRFYIVTNYKMDNRIWNPGNLVGNYFSDYYYTVDYQFNTVGKFGQSLGGINNTYGSDEKQWMVNVQSVNPLPTYTPTLTPTLTPTSTITSTQAVTPTPIPTSTIQLPEIKQRAQLQVTYEVGSLINDRLTIKVFLKNVGDATASNINLTIEHPHELEPIAASGSEKIGDTISWTGELLPNTEHITEYSVKAIRGKDVEIPLKVTYAKISREEKAKALGISPSTSPASISPQDMETILMVIKILKAAIPGFELLMAISILLIVHVFLKKIE